MRRTHTKLVRFIVRIWIKGTVLIVTFASTIQLGGADSAIAEIIPTTNETATEVTVSSPNQLDISGGQTSGDGHNLFHRFEQFDLQTGQTANFITVPDIQNVLSHIQGSASNIDGLLQITGSSANLYLINPSGILFGPNAQLNLPGDLTVTTATSVSFGNQLFSATGAVADLLANQTIDYSTFFGNPTAFDFATNAAIVNLGHLAVSPNRAITMMGATLLNTGSLSAPGGRLTLIATTAGNLIRIDAPDRLLSLEVSPASALQTASPSLSEMLTGSGFDYANTLVVEADGTVRLTRSGTALPTGDSGEQAMPLAGMAIASGTLSAASPDGLGGEINLLGSQVGVIDATISALGQTGGGVLRIGGDYLGGSRLPTARQTYIDAQSTLSADAIAQGNGGQIYVWSDEATQFYGHLSAQGGRLFGNGGFAEVSGKQALSYRGSINLAAPQGTLGHILFDPYSIIIKNGSSGGAPLPSPFFYNQAALFDVTFYEKDLELLSNVTLLAAHDIIIEDLEDGALSFVSPSNVTFHTDTNGIFGGSFIMRDTTDTIRTAGGDLKIVNDGYLEDPLNSYILLGNVDTRAVGTSPAGPDGNITLRTAGSITARSLNAGTGDIQLLGNSIDLAGGNSSVTAQNITLAPRFLEKDIRLGGAASNGLESVLDLSMTDLNAISPNTGQITIGSPTGLGDMTFLSDLPDIAPITLLGSENARLFGPNSNTLWTITGQNSGSLSSLPPSLPSQPSEPNPINFSGFGNLIGGNQNDTFNFAFSNPEQSPQVTQTIQGGAGTLTFTGNDIDLAAAVSGSGQLRLFPDLLEAETLTIGGNESSEQFNLSDLELNAIQAGFESIEIGSDRGGSLIVSGDQQFSSSVTLKSGGTIDSTNGTLSTLAGADITLRANGNIATGDLTSNGGDITLTSATGTLTTGAINSASEIQGGDITLDSAQNITTGYITAASTNPSDSPPAGGDISLTSGENIRAVEPVLSNGIPTSIETTPGGRITLTNKGSAPFRIGEAASTVPLNGTVGQITDQLNALSDVELRSPLREGNITIVTNADVINPEETPVISLPPIASPPLVTPPLAAPSVAVPPIVAPLINEERHSKGGGSSVVLSAPNSAETNEIFSQIETTASAQFEAYLSSSRNQPAKIATLAQVQDTLNRVRRQQSQVRPALVYAYFVPSAASAASVQPTGDTAERLPQPDDQLEVMVVTAAGTPIRQRQWGVTRAEVEATALEFRRQVTSQFSRPNQYLPGAQQLYQWLLAPIEADLSSQAINSLAFIMDDGLRTLPIAALHNGQQFLVEKYSLGLVPTFSLTNFGLEEGGSEGRAEEDAVARQRIIATGDEEGVMEADEARWRSLPRESPQQVLAMGASRFENQPALPAVEAELSFISDELWLGRTYLNEDFTLENLKTQVASHQYNTVHLATHATFSPGDHESAYIQLWEQRIGLAELEALNLGDSNIDLIILSACSTAMGDRNSEYGFAGFAVSAGSQSAMASLWPVSDEGTLGFMTQFYQHLPSAVTRSEALRETQMSLLNGDIGIDNGQLYDAHDDVLAVLPELEQSGSWNFSHPFYWSAFTMIGSPW
jgi:filamentous hemagglutinin family protein